jgi:hypothetical protein
MLHTDSDRAHRGRARIVQTLVLVVGIGAAALSACSASSGGAGGSHPGAGGATGGGNAPGAAATSGAGGSVGSGSGGSPFVGGFSMDSGSYVPPPPPTGSGGVFDASVPYTPPSGDPTPVAVNECPGSLDAATAQKLTQGGTGTAGTLLYPYDGTVFPVGLLPPLMQWSGQSAADGVYLHLKSKFYDYQGCFGANANSQLAIPDAAWATAGTQSLGADDPLSIDVVTISGGTVSAPLHETVKFALGKLKGDLFYNTYTSPQANNNGAVMRLHIGAATPEVLLTDTGLSPFGPCWSCHSLSANGAVLVAQHHQYPGGPYSSASFNLAANSGASPPATVQIMSSTAEMGLGAVYPDGSKVLTMGSPGDSTQNPVFPDAPGNVPAMIGPATTKLLDTATGQQYPLTGWNVQYAKMPSFSPDGSMVVFNWHEDSNGHSLAVANFDNNANVMSNVKVIYKNDTLFPGWPWITPDNKEVVFVLGNTQDYVSGYPGRVGIAASDLYVVDIETGNVRELARANGYAKSGSPTYLPNPGRDEHLEFFPTISPIAEGGYFWVFFTSRRTYGNSITQAVDDATTKKIWVSAYNIRSGDIIQDPSNPPFYLPGQEATSGNIRAFAALEPCHKDGDSCESGVDCCNGHCYQGSCGLPPPPPPPPPNEPPPPPACSKIDERCATAKDCCDATAQCINHFCTFVVPPS